MLRLGKRGDDSRGPPVLVQVEDLLDSVPSQCRDQHPELPHHTRRGRRGIASALLEGVHAIDVRMPSQKTRESFLRHEEHAAIAIHLLEKCGNVSGEENVPQGGEAEDRRRAAVGHRLARLTLGERPWKPGERADG